MVRPEPPLDAEGTVSCPGALQPSDWEREGRESSDDKHPESSSGAHPPHVTAGLGSRLRSPPVWPLLHHGALLVPKSVYTQHVP